MTLVNVTKSIIIQIESLQSHYNYKIIDIYSGISLPVFTIHAQDID